MVLYSRIIFGTYAICSTAMNIPRLDTIIFATPKT